MSGPGTDGEAVTREAVGWTLAWLAGVAVVPLVGGWLRARYVAALGVEPAAPADLAAGVLVLSCHLPTWFYARAGAGRRPVYEILAVSVAFHALGMVVLGAVPAPRCWGDWRWSGAAWCVVWGHSVTAWALARARTRGRLARWALYAGFGVGVVVSAWLFARGPYGLIPTDLGGGRPVLERVVIDGELFRAEVVRLGERAVVLTVECEASVFEVPKHTPLTLTRGTGREATRAHLEHRAGPDQGGCTAGWSERRSRTNGTEVAG